MGTKTFKTKMMKGLLNTISDVPGVSVGHTTLSKKSIQTGVTIIQPTKGNIFKEKLAAASYVVNGFGKTTGLMQIQELGTLESPIALTNTLSVGSVQQALVKHMLSANEDIGDTAGTVNVVVGECNDGYLNDIRRCAIQEQHVYEAIKDCKVDFEEGGVGAGTGMSCFEMKGGIGSASRIVVLDDKEYVVGALTLSNYGLKKDFVLENISFKNEEETVEKGSCIMVLATNIPMDARQLQRVCKRMSVALAKSGSYLGNGSGDIAIAFSTSTSIPHDSKTDILVHKTIHEGKIDIVFRAAIEAMQEAVLSSLVHAKTTIGHHGNIRYSLQDTIKNIKK